MLINRLKIVISQFFSIKSDPQLPLLLSVVCAQDQLQIIFTLGVGIQKQICYSVILSLARCCYSCRAFFRRTAPRSDSLRCRSSLGTCEISSKNKKCISCRYEKCLLIGMDPHLVQVHGEQRTIYIFLRIYIIVGKQEEI